MLIDDERRKRAWRMNCEAEPCEMREFAKTNGSHLDKLTRTANEPWRSVPLKILKPPFLDTFCKVPIAIKCKPLAL